MSRVVRRSLTRGPEHPSHVEHRWGRAVAVQPRLQIDGAKERTESALHLLRLGAPVRVGQCASLGAMCRNIRPLNNFAPPATDDEVRAAAVQYVRKIAGTTTPSAANEAAFENAVQLVMQASRELVDALVTTAPPKDRTAEADKARARAQTRYATAGPR